MSSDVLSQALVAGQVATFGRGRIFNLLQASAPVSIVAEYKGVGQRQNTHKVFTNIPAGSKFVSDPADGDWTFLRVTSGVNQNITLYIGDDDMTFNQAVTVTGVAQVNVNPGAAIATVGPTNVNNAAAVTVAANPARRRITVGAPTTNTGPVYLQTAGFATAKAGIPLSPGGFVELDTTASFDVRNDSGAVQQFSTFEET